MSAATLGILVVSVPLMVIVSRRANEGKLGWVRVAVTVAGIWLISPLWESRELGVGMIPLLLVAVAMVFLWRGELSFLMANGLVARFLFSWHGGGGGFRADFRAARSAFSEGDLEEAMRLVRAELAKDPGSYEGLSLAASIDKAERRYASAVEWLDRLLSAGQVTDAQRRVVEVERADCEYLRRHAELRREA